MDVIGMFFCPACGTFLTAVDLILLQQDDASDGIPQGISFKTSRPGKIEIGMYRCSGECIP
jgi:hypothetical protein